MGMFQKTRRGFSLTELILVMLLTSILLLAITGLFGSMFKTYRTARTMQRDVENAQFAMNSIAKTLRTSTIMKPKAGAGAEEETSNITDAKTLYIYDYSKSSCIIFKYSEGKETLYSLAFSSSTPDENDPEKSRRGCNFGDNEGGMQDDEDNALTTGDVDARFTVVPSDDSPKRVGKATVAIGVRTDPNHPVHLQTSVSLHDYVYVGLD